MKKIGLIGGISWVSTLDYYRYINEGINERLGGLNFAECLIYSVNFSDVHNNGWEENFQLLLKASQSLKNASADGIAICANTAHMHAPGLMKSIDLPLIHIGDATAKSINTAGLKTVGLLGTKYTMEMDFYREKLESYGLKVIIPAAEDTRNYIQDTIRDELGRGLILAETKRRYLSIAAELVDQGAQGIILGCTEIPLLIGQADFDIPVFDTTRIHAKAIVDFALS